MANFPIDLAVGAYSPTYNGLGPLILEGQPQLAFRSGGTEHRGALFGSNVIEIVDNGIEAAFVIMTLKEWNAVTRAIIWPWGTIGQAGVPFSLFSTRARALVFTAEAGSPAATLGPVTRTFQYAGLAPNQNVTLPQGGDHRNIPVVMQVLAYPHTSGSHASDYFIDT